MKLELSRHIFKNTFSHFVTIRLGGGELFHWDGQTDRHDEANGRFSPFCISTQEENQILEYVQVYFHAFYICPWHQCGLFVSWHLIRSKETGYILVHITGPRSLKGRDMLDAQNDIISDLREECFEYVN